MTALPASARLLVGVDALSGVSHVRAPQESADSVRVVSTRIDATGYSALDIIESFERFRKKIIILNMIL